MRGFGGRERGQALIEMALVLPLLIFLMMGMATFGIAINSKIAVSGAAREAAREYAVSKDAGKMRNRAEEFLKGSITASDSEFVACFNKAADVTHSIDGNYVTVRVTYHQPVYVPGLFLLLGGSSGEDRMSLSSSATFKLEQ